jgi:predicted outer membrane repeat protein
MISYCTSSSRGVNQIIRKIILRFFLTTKRNSLTAIFIFSCIAASAQQRYYINVSATGTNTGTSWANAFTTINAAYTKVSAGDTLWIARGTYLATTDTDRLKSMYFKDGVKVYGGFTGNETFLGQRDWVNNQTILSGDIGIAGDNTDNSYHILLVSGQVAGLELDGLIITEGNCRNQVSIPIGSPGFDPNEGKGAGITASTKESVVFRNCIISNNTSKNGGGFGGTRSESSFYKCVFKNNNAFDKGGAFYNALSGNVKFSECEFSENTARYGAAIDHASNVNAAERSVTNITDCNFVKNTSIENGGAVRFSEGAIKGSFFERNKANMGGAVCTYASASPDGGTRFIKNCKFNKNKATGMGGALYSAYSMNISNSSFYRNEAGGSGGAIGHMSHSNFKTHPLRIHNCTIINNSCGNIGGALYAGATIDFYFDISIANCIVWDNDAKGRIVKTFYSGQITPNGARYTNNEVRVNNCLINAEHAMGNPATNTNIWANPGLDTTSVSYWQLSDGSAAIHAGIADTTGLLVGNYDLELNNRMQHGRVDIGASEYQGSFIPATGIAIRSENDQTSVALQDTLSLYADFTPANATNRGVKWKIVDGFAYGMIDGDGNLSSPDQTTPGVVRVQAVSVYDESVKAEKEFTFYRPVSTIALYTAGDITQITAGETLQILATILPSTATDKTLSWEVIEGASIASVSSEGLLTPAGQGVVTVKATALDGSGKSGTYQVTITAVPVPVSEIVLSTEGNITEITTGESLQITATVLPEQATNKTLSWEILEGSACAGVSSTGLLTVTCEGPVIVKASAADGSGVSAQYELTVGSVITGLTKNNEKAITVYPNPTEGKVYIDLTRCPGPPGFDVEVLDSMGRSKLTIHAPENAFDFQAPLSSGIYTFRITKGVHRLNEKVIIR